MLALVMTILLRHIKLATPVSVRSKSVTNKSHKVFVCLLFYVPGNSYGNARTVSSPNHSFYLMQNFLNQQKGGE